MRRRRNLDETRELLLDTGVRLLLDSGVNVTLGAINLIDVCRAAGLTTAGSGYKIWETQEMFRIELLRHLLFVAVPGAESIEMLTEAVEAPETDLPELTELIRTVAGASADDVIGGSASPVYLALWLAAVHDPELAGNLWTADQALIDAYAELYEAILARFDLEWRPPFDARLLAVSLSSLAEGMDIHSRANPELISVPLARPTGPDGAPQDWHLFACGAEALIRAFTRPRGGDGGG